MKVQCYYSVTNVFQLVKYIVRHVIEVRKSGTPCFSCQSLFVVIAIKIENTLMI